MKKGAPLVADFRIGQNFSGGAHAYFETRSARFDILHDDKAIPVDSRIGDVPALQTTAPEDGLLVIVHETTPSTLVYREWKKFRTFAKHKDFPNIGARHRERGLPDDGFTESYTRHVKALVGVGTAEGEDLNAGMEVEFVALSNPYTDDPSGGFAVALYYQDIPRINAQVQVFDRAPNGIVTVTFERTNSAGQAIIPVQSGHEYLLDSVVLRTPTKDGEAVWETLWAGMTFLVP